MAFNFNQGIPNAILAGMPQNDKSSSFYKSVDDSVKGTRFEQIVSANPYVSYNYTPSFWDKLGNALGWRTQEDKYREQMELAAREYDAQAIQNMSEEQYNTPSAMAQRMRDAGLNPDLQGLSDVAPASEFAQEQTSPDLSHSSISEDFVKTLVGVVGNAVGIANQFVGLQSAIKDYDSKDLKSFADSLGISDQLTSLAYGMYGDAATAVSQFDPEDFSKQPFFSSLNRRNRKRVESALAFAVHKPENRNSFWKSEEEGQKARISVSEGYASGLAKDMSESQDVWNDAAQEIAKLKLEEFKVSLKLSKSKNQYGSDYYDNLNPFSDAALHNLNTSNDFIFGQKYNPDAAADSVNESNLTNALQQRLTRHVRESIERLVGKWKEKSQNGNPAATAALIALGTLSYTGLPHVSQSQSDSVNRFGGSHSQSFGVGF